MLLLITNIFRGGFIPTHLYIMSKFLLEQIRNKN